MNTTITIIHAPRTDPLPRKRRIRSPGNRSRLQLIALSLLCLLLASCSSVKPWERGYLAAEVMRAQPSEQITAFEQHMYASKEATEGGVSFGGGGCGCN